MPAPVAPPSLARARLCLVAAAVLWSAGSLFMRLLREPTALGLNDPDLSPLQIAFYRGLFGGLVVLLLVRRRDVRGRPLMAGMVVTFTAMSGMYLTALGLGPAANAIFLQNTSPVWVYLFAVFVLGERGDARGWQAVLLGGLGAVVIVVGNWSSGPPSGDQATQRLALVLGLGSAVAYGGVMIFLRALRAESTAWLVALNLLGTAATLAVYAVVAFGPAGAWAWVAAPSPAQLGVLVVFGAVQMAAPYWLFARGLRTVPPREAGIITLIEPLLNPVWAYLITPEKDTPTEPMLAGGALILAALVWRYVPSRRDRNRQSNGGTPASAGPADEATS